MKNLFLVLFLSGCASAPVITYEVDRLGVPSCVVDGVRQEMTDDERDYVGRKYIDEYCPIK